MESKLDLRTELTKIVGNRFKDAQFFTLKDTDNFRWLQISHINELVSFCEYIEKQAQKSMVDKFWDWGIKHMPTMYFNHVMNWLNDFILSSEEESTDVD